MKNSSASVYPVLVSGFCGVIIQCVLIRELLTVFAGNELILGIIFAVWLTASGAGSYRGVTRGLWRPVSIAAVLVPATLFSLLTIRLFPTFVPPGAVLPPLTAALLLILSEAPISFLTGYVFGTLSKSASGGSSLYLMENCGVVVGSIFMFGLTLINMSNTIILGVALLAIPTLVLLDSNHQKNRRILSFITLTIAAVSSAALIIATDRTTVSWKYAGPVNTVTYTREGEVAVMIHAHDTTWLLNNALYKSTMQKQVAEQAVHIPVSQRSTIKKVLVIFDRGHCAELAKYPEIRPDVLETIPQLASVNSIFIAPEKYHPDKTYDLILLGAPPPENTASNRFYTVSFLRHCKSLLSTDGLLSFTLPFSESYMSSFEQQLYTVMLNTLKAVFSHVLVFPGEGSSTFMASESALSIPDHIIVSTDYLSAYTLPSLSKEKIRKANPDFSTAEINTTTRPTALLLALKNWMQQFGYSAIILLSIAVCILITAVIFLPRTPQVLSVATSGFSTGLYTICIMLLYQATYGSLYAEIALLMIALSGGFVAGSFVRRFPLSDAGIAIYALASIMLLAALPQPSAFLFMICIGGAGFLSAAQFVTRKAISPGILNAADLIGGVFGMALSSTLLIPLFGILPVMIGVCGIKIICTLVFRGSDVSDYEA